MKNYTQNQRVKVALLAVGFLCATAVSAMAAEFVSVVKDGVNLRSGPDTTNEVLFKLPKGYPLKVMAIQSKWMKVSDYEGDKGWIFSSLVSKEQYVIVKVKEGNVRSGPGTQNGKIGKVVRDVIVKKVATQGDWVKISDPRLTGWVHKQLVWP